MSDKFSFFRIDKAPFFEHKNGWIQLIFMLLFVFVGALFLNIFSSFFAMVIWGKDILSDPTAGCYRFLQFFSTLGSFFIPSLLFSYCADKHFFTYSSANKFILDRSMLIYVLLISITIIPLVSFVVYWNQQLHLPEMFSKVETWMLKMEEHNNHILEIITNDPRLSILALNIFICAFLPAVCEEFFFRGTLQVFCIKHLKNPHLAIWVTGFIFSFIHLQFQGFFARWLLGVYLGYLFLWGGSIWLPICAHFLHNTFSVLVQFLITRSVLPQNTDTLITSQIPSVIAALFMSALLFWGIYRAYKQQISQP